MSAMPAPAPIERSRYNFEPDLSCPRCYRGERALERLATAVGLYTCRGCLARFRFEQATDYQAATLIHVVEPPVVRTVDTPYNAGARTADDVICQCCGARGHSEVVCRERNAQPREGR